MNYNELYAEIVRNGFSIPQVADAIGISRKAFYAKMRGESQFKQREIRDLKSLLALSNQRVNELFFCS